MSDDVGRPNSPGAADVVDGLGGLALVATAPYLLQRPRSQRRCARLRIRWSSPDQHVTSDGLVISAALSTINMQSRPFVVGFFCAVTLISPNADAAHVPHPQHPVEPLMEHIVAPSGSITMNTVGRDAIHR
jgi:hypothetical protein